MIDQSFNESLTDLVNIKRNTDAVKKTDNYGNEITTTVDGEFPTIATDVKCLIISLLSLISDISLEELGIIEKEGSVMYVNFDQDIQKNDYVINKENDDEFIVAFVNKGIPEEHHKEIILKRNIDNG